MFYAAILLVAHRCCPPNALPFHSAQAKRARVLWMDRVVAIIALVSRVAIAFKGGKRCDCGVKDCLGQVCGQRALAGGQEHP